MAWIKKQKNLPPPQHYIKGILSIYTVKSFNEKAQSGQIWGKKHTVKFT